MEHQATPVSVELIQVHPAFPASADLVVTRVTVVQAATVDSVACLVTQAILGLDLAVSPVTQASVVYLVILALVGSAAIQVFAACPVTPVTPAILGRV